MIQRHETLYIVDHSEIEAEMAYEPRCCDVKIISIKSFFTKVASVVQVVGCYGLAVKSFHGDTVAQVVVYIISNLKTTFNE